MIDLIVLFVLIVNTDMIVEAFFPIPFVASSSGSTVVWEWAMVHVGWLSFGCTLSLLFKIRGVSAHMMVVRQLMGEGCDGPYRD